MFSSYWCYLKGLWSLRIKHMELKKKEDQSVDTLILLRKGNKILIEVTEKCGTEAEGKAIQRLPHLGIHPTCRHQNPDTIADAKKCLLIRA
jgi:hypothetical protein